MTPTPTPHADKSQRRHSLSRQANTENATEEVTFDARNLDAKRPSVKTSQRVREKASMAPKNTQQKPQRIPAQQRASFRRSSSYFGSRTDVGHARDHNEDSLVVMPPLFAVADGMGGHEAGEVASEIAIQTISELAPKTLDAKAFAHAVQAANLNVLKAPSRGIGREGMGTTFTGALLDKERLLVAQVGDSRAYLLHHGRIQQITRDHSLMADLIEAGQITPAEARIHPNRSVITRAIGSDPHTLPDIYELNVSAGDRLLLCSDGLNSMIEDDQIEDILRSTPDPQKCADNLVEAALDAGGLDNVTVIVVDIRGNSQKKVEKHVRKSRALFIFIAFMLVALFALAAFGGYQYVNNSAYLKEENGKVCIYRGMQDDLFGIPLSSLEKTTSVEVDKLQPGVANRIKEGMKVDSLEEADRLIQSYEEEIAKSESSKNSNASTSSNSSNTNSSSTANASSTSNTSNSSSSNSTNSSTNTNSTSTTSNNSSSGTNASTQTASQGGN